jgi:hypothetical protein
VGASVWRKQMKRIGVEQRTLTDKDAPGVEPHDLRVAADSEHVGRHRSDRGTRLAESRRGDNLGASGAYD